MHSQNVYPLLLFDGDCTFCRKCAALLRPLGAQEIKWLPYQSFDNRELEAMGTSREACEQALQFIPALHRAPISGADAINFVLLSNPAFGPLTWLLRNHAFLRIERLLYNAVARHRATLSRIFAQ